MLNPNRALRNTGVSIALVAGAFALAKHEIPSLGIHLPHIGTQGKVTGVKSHSELKNVTNVKKVFLVEGQSSSTAEIDAQLQYTGVASGLLNKTVPGRCMKTTVYQEGTLQLGVDAGGIEMSKDKTGGTYPVKVNTSKFLLQLVSDPNKTHSDTQDCFMVRARGAFNQAEAKTDERRDEIGAYGAGQLKRKCGFLLTDRLTEGLIDFTKTDQHLSPSQKVTVTYVDGKGQTVPAQVLRGVDLHEGPVKTIQQLAQDIFGNDDKYKIGNVSDQPCSVSAHVLKQLAQGGQGTPAAAPKY
jgi:hypothetical protein